MSSSPIWREDPKGVGLFAFRLTLGAGMHDDYTVMKSHCYGKIAQNMISNMYDFSNRP
jgi:hypothetical protein